VGSTCNRSGGVGKEHIHAFAGSPSEPDQAYFVDVSSLLYVTEDRGQTWTPIIAPIPSPNCGGIPFIKANAGIVAGPDGLPLRAVDLYFGNRCGIARLGAPAIPGTNRFSYSAAWVGMAVDHDDTRDLGFDAAGRPLLLASDGGLHRTPDGLGWHFTGGGSAGYNALQVTEVRGQWITGIGAFDIYFGTQDNGLRALVDGSAAWAGIGPEGYFIDAERSVADKAAAWITYSTPYGIYLSPRGFPFPMIDWKSPPRVAGPPKVIRESTHVQTVKPSTPPLPPGVFDSGFAITGDFGAKWSPYAGFPEQPRAAPQLTHAPSGAAPGMYAVLYQAVRVGWYGANDYDLIHFVRAAENPFSAMAKVSYPAMNGFGGLGIAPTIFAWYPVFAVDPGNANHLIAPDVINEKMQESWDGGNNWTDMAALTSLVTEGGKLRFRNWIFPQASAISFSPDDPNMIAVGTMEGGVLVSSDRGKTWSQVPGSERASFITSLEWRTDQELIVATYGRGLWRLQWQLLVDLGELTCPPPCFSVKLHPPSHALPVTRLRPGVAVLHGEIRGADIGAGGVVRELFVSPGSAVALVAKSANAPRIKVTETTRWRGFSREPQWRVHSRRRMIVALGLTGANHVSDIVLARRQLSAGAVLPPVPLEQLRGNAHSSAAGKPYIDVSSESADGQDAATVKRKLTSGGTRFQRCRPGRDYLERRRRRQDDAGQRRALLADPDSTGGAGLLDGRRARSAHRKGFGRVAVPGRA
jgi:hypothetical protein